MGAFQLGIAAALAAGIAGRRALAVGLWGGAVGGTAQAASPWIDADLGGRSTDPVLITLVALVLVVGLVAAEVRRSGPSSQARAASSGDALRRDSSRRVMR